MQTKSPLVKMAIMAGVPLAILALFLWARFNAARIHPSRLQAIIPQAPPTCDAALLRAKGRFDARVRQAAAGV